jgi:hypothetical protein
VPDPAIKKVTRWNPADFANAIRPTLAYFTVSVSRIGLICSGFNEPVAIAVGVIVMVYLPEAV